MFPFATVSLKSLRSSFKFPPKGQRDPQVPAASDRAVDFARRYHDGGGKAAGRQQFPVGDFDQRRGRGRRTLSDSPSPASGTRYHRRLDGAARRSEGSDAGIREVGRPSIGVRRLDLSTEVV